MSNISKYVILRDLGIWGQDPWHINYDDFEIYESCGKMAWYLHFSFMLFAALIHWDFNILLMQSFILLSCTIAIGTNLSQFICIGRFTAVSFQVLGHMKTVLVLILGFLFFGKEGLNLHVVLGMFIAILGMIWYGNASSLPGGKERRQPTSSNNLEEKNPLVESTQSDEKV